MFTTLSLAMLLICVFFVAFWFFLRRIVEKDFIPPNALLLCDAWRQEQGYSGSDKNISVTI